MINMNDFAKTITEKEGGLEEVNIAQIKEIIKLTLEEVAKLGTARALKLLERYR